MSYQLKYSDCIRDADGVADLTEEEVQEIKEHDIKVEQMGPEKESRNPKVRHAKDDTWALVEHIVEDAISVIEEAIQYAGVTSSKLIAFSLERSYRRVKTIRAIRGICTIEDLCDTQDFFENDLILQEHI